jgi:predicted tellurium resistance membrane protein TerC
MFGVNVTTDWLILIASGVLSLLFSWFPLLNRWYAGLREPIKKVIMAGAILLVVVTVLVLTCYGVIESNLVCTKEGIAATIGIYLLAVGVNQGLFKITPQFRNVKEIKLRQANKEENKLLK